MSARRTKRGMPPAAPVDPTPEALRSAPAVRSFAGLAELLQASAASQPAKASAPPPAPPPQRAIAPVTAATQRADVRRDDARKTDLGTRQTPRPGADVVADEGPALDDDSAFLAALSGDSSVMALGKAKAERAVRVPTFANPTAPTATARDTPAIPSAPLDPFLSELADFGVDMPRWAAPGNDEFAEQLARGALRIDSHVDLHGLERRAAVDRLIGAVGDAAARGEAVLRVIHGRGLHSPGGQPALRDAVREALVRPPLRPMVRAWSQALPADGGAGATLVLLSTRGLAGKRSRR